MLLTRVRYVFHGTLNDCFSLELAEPACNACGHVAYAELSLGVGSCNQLTLSGLQSLSSTGASQVEKAHRSTADQPFKQGFRAAQSEVVL